MTVYMPVSNDIYALPLGLFYTEIEVAEFLGISERHVRRLIVKNKIVKVTI